MRVSFALVDFQNSFITTDEGVVARVAPRHPSADSTAIRVNKRVLTPAVVAADALYPSMSQFKQFALNSEPREAPEEAFGVRAEDLGTINANLGSDAANKRGEEVAGMPDVGEEEEVWEATAATSEDESIEVMEDDSSEDESKENNYKGAGHTSRPSRAAKNKAFNYQVDAEGIDVEVIGELEGSQTAAGLEDSEGKGARGRRYVDSSSDEEGPSEEEKLIIKEAKTGLKNIECILWQRRS